MSENNGHAELAPKGARKLTAKQTAFVDATLVGNSPSDAYRLAYDAAGMSAKAISVEAARLLAHPSITLAISEGREVTRHERRLVPMKLPKNCDA